MYGILLAYCIAASTIPGDAVVTYDKCELAVPRETPFTRDQCQAVIDLMTEEVAFPVGLRVFVFCVKGDQPK